MASAAHDIYICYAPADLKTAEAVCDRLEAAGIQCWYAPRNLLPGEDWVTQIIEAIGTAKAVVLIVSDNTCAARQVTSEIRKAVEMKIRIIPFRITEAGLTGPMQYHLAAVHELDAQGEKFEGATEDLANILLHMRSRQDREEPGQTAAPQSAPKAERKCAPRGGSFFGRLKNLLTGGGGGGGGGTWTPEPVKPPYVPEKTPPAEDRVSFSVLSPLAVRANASGIVNVHMYTAAQREAVERAIRESDGMLKETSKGGFAVSRETSVTVRLSSPDIELRDASETQLWTGEALHFDFLFSVPPDYGRTQIAFVCHVEYNGIPVTRLNFLVAVTAEAETVSSPVPAKVTRSDYRKAFISYSRKDEQRMLARVVSIQELAPAMKFWLDKRSMDAGDFWRDEIRRAIRISDVLLLFWSQPASKSAEVEKEWRYGLEQKGLSFIAPVPLDPPETCPPPEPLQALNFNMRAFSDGKIPESLSFYDSNNLIVL